MNDIEKAIVTLKDMKGYFNYRSHRQYSMPAIDLAIEALEKQINDEPCHYCNSIKIATPASPRHNYKYCPMCGRKRSEVEDERRT